MRRLLVCGIGTHVGKTVVSSILVKALGAHYWKPIQTGSSRDSEQVKQWAPEAVCYDEAYALRRPLAPHHAAALEGISLDFSAFRLPQPNAPLVIEAIGGVLVPYSANRLLIDLYREWDCDWVLVSRHYLGSINHTLLTLEALRKRGIRLRGLIFNGAPNPYSEQAILSFARAPCLARLLPEREMTPQTIQRYADKWQNCL